jgi:hypothetical protein
MSWATRSNAASLRWCRVGDRSARSASQSSNSKSAAPAPAPAAAAARARAGPTLPRMPSDHAAIRARRVRAYTASGPNGSQAGTATAPSGMRKCTHQW